jgi:hypothetical protein
MALVIEFQRLITSRQHISLILSHSDVVKVVEVKVKKALSGLSMCGIGHFQMQTDENVTFL